MEARNDAERKIVLAINACMFVFELALGLVAQSTGLIANSICLTLIGLVIAVVVLRGGIHILKDAASNTRCSTQP